MGKKRVVYCWYVPKAQFAEYYAAFGDPFKEPDYYAYRNRIIALTYFYEHYYKSVEFHLFACSVKLMVDRLSLYGGRWDAAQMSIIAKDLIWCKLAKLISRIEDE